MVEAKTKTIDGKEITVTQFPAFQGLRLKTKLIKAIGPAVGSLISGKSKTGSIDPLDQEVDLEKAIGSLVQNLDEEQTPILIEQLLSMTRINGKEITRDVFNMEFAGNYALMYKIIAFVLEMNHFFDFLNTGILAGKLSSMTSGIPSTDSLTKQS